MLGSVNSVILRLRTSAFVALFGVLGMAACASSENATFDEPGGEVDAGLTDAKSDAKPDTDSGAGGEGGSGGSGGDGGQGGDGGSGGNGGEPDTCGLATCPEPEYPDFQKCCTSADQCGYKNGPSGFCYDAVPPEDPGAGGGGP